MPGKSDKLKKLQAKIEKLLGESGRSPLNHKQIAKRLGVDSTEERDQIILALKQLEHEEVVDQVQPGKFILRFRHQFLTGKVDMTQRGHGYIVPDGESDLGDIYISQENMNTALHGDLVKVNLLPAKTRDRQHGEVIEVIERNRTEFVGVIQLHANYAFVVPDDKRMYADIFIPKDKAGKARHGEKVIAGIVSWNIDDKNPQGEIIEVLGRPGDHETEMNAIVAEFGFPIRFPAQVEKEAARIPDKIGEEEISKRKDFRKVLTFTIDPADAKDFDDAISFKKNKDGTYEIGIHIADVSHYVKEGSKLDTEAFNRGTSVYLVDRTIPMLPEKLSNGVCSLRPNEEKLCFSVVVKMNDEAMVLDTWMGKTVIYSDRRFSYEEAQERLESGEGDLAAELKILNEIAKKMRDERFKQGAISFETQEVKFKLDEHFKPVDIFIKVRKDAHKLIEEFMLLANRKVAEYASGLLKGKNKYTFVYRVHEEPNPEKLRMFGIFASRFGYRIETTVGSNIAKQFNRLLEQVEGKPEQNVLQSQAVRTMQKAFYTTEKTSHYGLAFSHYTHFTSPIRRYPDLMAHRLLFEYLNGKPSSNQKAFEEACRHSSAMELKAAEAERASIKYKQVEYIRDFVGEEFRGIISGVTEWGIYVEITKFKCEGMVRLASIEDDHYIYDEQNQWIIGQRTHRKFQFGDELDVIVMNADILKRQIDLALVDPRSEKQFKDDWKKEKSRREKKKKTRRGR